MLLSPDPMSGSDLTLQQIKKSVNRPLNFSYLIRKNYFVNLFTIEGAYTHTYIFIVANTTI